MTHLKLKAPDVLPPTGVTSTSFQVFVNRLTAYILQDTNNYMFVSVCDDDEGIYSTFKPLQSGKRITTLHYDDPDLIEITALTVAADIKNRKKAKLLLTMNSQLQKCIQLVADFVHYTESNDIVQRCTSINWVWSYLRQHYNIID